MGDETLVGVSWERWRMAMGSKYHMGKSETLDFSMVLDSREHSTFLSCPKKKPNKLESWWPQAVKGQRVALGTLTCFWVRLFCFGLHSRQRNVDQILLPVWAMSLSQMKLWTTQCLCPFGPVIWVIDYSRNALPLRGWRTGHGLTYMGLNIDLKKCFK